MLHNINVSQYMSTEEGKKSQAIEELQLINNPLI